MSDVKRHEDLLRLFRSDRFLAHKHFFPQRHKDESPEFHEEIIKLFNSLHTRVALMAFRGAAKSTLLEEYVLLSLLFQEEDYVLFVGPKWESACEHLEPIRNEIEMNDIIRGFFGDQKANPWSMDELQLANGRKVKAIGAGQSMRGTKSNNERPTLAAIDDLEDESNIATEESRRRTDRWMTGTLIPALHPTKGKVRFIGTPIHPKALITKKTQDSRWISKIFPISHINDDGREVSSWEARFPLSWIENQRADYLSSGNLTEFEQEYMCRAEDVAGKPFQASMIKVAPAPEHYLPVEIIVDPARTIKSTSARTGYVAASWSGNKLLVHDALGAFHRPDEIVNTIFEWNHRFRPVHIGVETNSLEEFIMQPLRAKMLQSGVSLPLLDLRAPKDKIDFIKGLQPFYMSGNVIHAKHLPDLETELLQFPTGRMDVPNALAYFLRIRAGRVVYDDFTSDHIAPVLELDPYQPRWLLVSGRPSLCAAMLVQFSDGVFRIYRDWVQNKPPLEALPGILREAIMLGAGQVKLAAPQEQFDKYTNNGISAAAKRENIAVARTGWATKCEGKIKPWLTKRERGDAAFLVDAGAHWTINGFMRGYARKLEKDGTLADLPTDNQYRVLMEALESFVGWFDQSTKSDDAGMPIRYAVASDGRRYISSLPDARPL